MSSLRERIPLEIFHRITFRCNLKCNYCGIWREKRNEMNTKNIKKAIKEFAEAGTIFWGFSGGEPLLRKDIGELISFAKNQGIDFIQVITNGILLRKKLKELKKVDQICISLDGPKEIHEKTRGKGTFQKVVESIKIAKKEGFNITIISVLNKYNIEKNFYGLKWLFNFAKNLNLQINFQPIFHDQYCKGITKPLEVSKEEYIKALKLIEKFKRETGLVRNSLSLYEEWIKNYEGKKSRLKCFAGRKYAVLFPDGLLAPCFLREREGLNGLDIGFLNAFKKIPFHPNCHCMSCFNENNLLYSLKPEVIKNTIFQKLNLFG